jgi:hypothetical protein
MLIGGHSFQPPCLSLSLFAVAIDLPRDIFLLSHFARKVAKNQFVLLRNIVASAFDMQQILRREKKVLKVKRRSENISFWILSDFFLVLTNVHRSHRHLLQVFFMCQKREWKIHENEEMKEI